MLLFHHQAMSIRPRHLGMRQVSSSHSGGVGERTLWVRVCMNERKWDPVSGFHRGHPCKIDHRNAIEMNLIHRSHQLTTCDEATSGDDCTHNSNEHIAHVATNFHHSDTVKWWGVKVERSIIRERESPWEATSEGVIFAAVIKLNLHLFSE